MASVPLWQFPFTSPSSLCSTFFSTKKSPLSIQLKPHTLFLRYSSLGSKTLFQMLLSPMKAPQGLRTLRDTWTLPTALALVSSRIGVA